MLARMIHILVALIMITTFACGSSNDKSDSDDDAAEAKKKKDKDAEEESDDSKDDEDEKEGKEDKEDAVAGKEDTDVDSPSSLAAAVCGNGEVEGDEECDDGDLNPRNGCTPLCELSCTIDEDCDDLNDCNGIETCTEDNACDDSDEPLEDGEACGDSKSCWKGLCVDDVCGDGKVTEGEKCDDGDRDPDNGCNADCEWSCEEDSDCSSKDTCLGDRQCKDHACEGGNPLENETACDIMDADTKKLCGDSGWCMNGVCTCANCGNGTKEDGEDCDDGEKNGTPDSPNNCSIACKVIKCGDGKVQGEEECDDGNQDHLDGCDEDCKYEFVHRLSSMVILQGPPPDWCYYDGNRFGEAFSSEVSIMGYSINILEQVNTFLSQGIMSGGENLLVHLSNSDDTSMRTVDEEITLGVYSAIKGPKAWDENEPKPVDFPFYIQPGQVEEDGSPGKGHRIDAVQMGGGKVVSEEPQNFSVEGLIGTYSIVNYKMQLVYDLSSSSTPKVPASRAEVSKNLKLPEQSGVDPQGLYCGAIESSAISQGIGTGEFSPAGEGIQIEDFCCKNNGVFDNPMYTPCAEDQEPGVDCDSLADILQKGCTVCINLDELSIGQAAAGGGGFGSDCSLMETDPIYCFEIIHGIDYDVDTDDDGKNDSWSMLFGTDGRRARFYGIAEE